jgi:hypothetical protein
MLRRKVESAGVEESKQPSGLRSNLVIKEAAKESVTPLLVALDREVDREINSRSIAEDDA